MRPVVATLGCGVYPLRGTAVESDLDAETGTPTPFENLRSEHTNRGLVVRRHGENQRNERGAAKYSQPSAVDEVSIFEEHPSLPDRSGQREMNPED